VQVGSWVAQWSNDLLMWENKVFMRRPVLIKGDGPVTRLRGWFKQFYSSGEPRLSLAPAPDAGDVGTETAPSTADADVTAKCPAKGAAQW
jgi:hypothetical protein